MSCNRGYFPDSFQSTLPRRERRAVGSRAATDTEHFNPRSREGSDLLCRCNRAERRQFQSTLPRRERRPLGMDGRAVIRISIHAPAKGATSLRSILRAYGAGISIHAPAKGATCSCMFGVMVADISIHAPAKGATVTVDEIRAVTCHFNPRSREGSDSKNHQDYSQ